MGLGQEPVARTAPRRRPCPLCVLPGGPAGVQEKDPSPASSGLFFCAGISSEIRSGLVPDGGRHDGTSQVEYADAQDSVGPITGGPDNRHRATRFLHPGDSTRARPVSGARTQYGPSPPWRQRCAQRGGGDRTAGGGDSILI